MESLSHVSLTPKTTGLETADRVDRSSYILFIKLWVLMWQKTARPETESRGECIGGVRESGAGQREALAED